MSDSNNKEPQFNSIGNIVQSSEEQYQIIQKTIETYRLEGIMEILESPTGTIVYNHKRKQKK